MSATPRRARVDWIEAEAAYLGAGSARTFTAVAEQFKVSVTRVCTVARRDNWVEKAIAIDREALRKATARVVLTRTERVAKTLGIVDGLLDRFDKSLDDLELKPGEIPGLVKLAELLEGEATDRVSSAEAQEMFGALMALAAKAITEGWQVSVFLATVRETIGQAAGGELEAA